MFKKMIEFPRLKSILYPKELSERDRFNFGQDNRIYRSLINIFTQFWIYNKKELFLVGGCVRDLLLDKEPKDYDLCTNATPEEIKKIADDLGFKTIDTGIKHGTVTVIDDFYKMSYEVTTYRVDGKYEDGRHPENVEFVQSLEEDLKRRDFTINSFAYNLLTCELVCLDESFLNDLENGIIRCVGNPVERFQEDALRMLRALRFAAQNKFFIDGGTYNAIKSVAPNLENISKERIRDEMTKILLSDDVEILEQFVDTGMEKYCFDGITPIGDMLAAEHNCNWHYTDVLHHTFLVVNRVPKTFVMRWAALLHDVGKPKGRTEFPPGSKRYHYHGHPEVSAKIAEPFMEMLKFSNDQKDLIYKFVKFHDLDLSNARNGTFKKFLVEIGPENFNDFMKLQVADAYAHTIKDSILYNNMKISRSYARFNQIVIEDQPLKVTDLAINGNDIIADGFSQGKEIGDCLNWLLDIVLEHPEYNNREKLLELLQQFKKTAN
ncbi:MAG: HD domain-containing protein [Bacilli bacterium]|nr:HD domain-containing protein [Bacilli bacterium]